MILTLAIVCASAPAAGAEDRFTLDTQPVSDGHVVMDAAGNAYFGWIRSGVGIGVEPAMFCKVPPGGTCTTPIALPITGAVSLSDSASAVFPVLGPGSTVYAVAPRYANNDVIVWTSTNGGASFGASSEREFYSSRTDPTDVFLSGPNFLIGAFNAGLGFSTTEVAGAGGGSLSFSNPGDTVGSSSMGLDGANPVIAYWTFSDPDYSLRFYRYKGAGSLNSEASWDGPTTISNGYQPSLAGGPAGLFMVSQDYSGGQYPTAINLRRFAGSGFGAPTNIVTDATANLFIGGDIAQSASGNRLAVVWPGTRPDGTKVLRLFGSTDGGASFAASHVSRLGDAYSIGPNAELAVGDGGSGWVVYRDSAGLRVADLTPIAAEAPKSPPKPGKYKGKTKVADTKKAGDFDLTLRLPKACVQPSQKFFAGVGKRKRRGLSKKLGGRIKFNKVAFFFDGKKLRVKKKKPFRYLIDPGAMAPGSTHVVKARVTATLTKAGDTRKVKRTLKGTIKAC